MLYVHLVPFRLLIWLVVIHVLDTGSLRQYFSLYQAVSQREEEKRNDRREKKYHRNKSALTASTVGLCLATYYSHEQAAPALKVNHPQFDFKRKQITSYLDRFWAADYVFKSLVKRTRGQPGLRKWKTSHKFIELRI